MGAGKENETFGAFLKRWGLSTKAEEKAKEPDKAEKALKLAERIKNADKKRFRK